MTADHHKPSGCGAIQAAVATKFHDDAHSERIAERQVQPLGAMYSLRTGEVQFLEDERP